MTDKEIIQQQKLQIESYKNLFKMFDFEESMDKFLKDREKRAMILRFGLQGESMSAYRKIGKEFSVGVERARQITTKAIVKIKYGGINIVLEKTLSRWIKIYLQEHKCSHDELKVIDNLMKYYKFK